jgi:protein TonB
VTPAADGSLGGTALALVRMAGVEPSARATSATLGWVAGSALVHAVLVAAFLWRPGAGSNDDGAQAATVQVEYVNQDATTKGAPAPDPAAEPAPDPSGAAAAAEAAPPPPLPDPYADVPMPSAAPQSSAAASAIPTSRPAVNLGDADDDRDALTVIGKDVVSSGPDATFRNMPPNYPREAIRRHQQGSVQVLVHITPEGEAGVVELITSSGSLALDNAARDAVMKWHFKPALRDGMPIASVYPMQMNFRSLP